MYRVEQTSSGNDIIIDGFEAGIADSPYMMDIQTAYGNLTRTGLSDMRNVNIISIPGEASILNQTVGAQQTAITGASYSVTAANDSFTYSGTALKNGTAIVITVTTGSTGITSGNTYWVRDATATTFKVSAKVDSTGTVGTVVDVTLDGTGTFTTVAQATFTQIVPSSENSYSFTGIGGEIFQLPTLYAVDTNGRAWVFNRTTPNWVYLGNTTISSSPPRPNGIAYWNGYILIFRAGNLAIDYLKYGNDNTQWVYGWKNLTPVASFPARTFTDYNGTLYWCNGSTLGSLIQLTTFDPTNAATFTISGSALTLPAPALINCIEQLGTNLVVGGTSNLLYFWNKSDLGPSSNIILPETGISRLVTINSNTYIFAGNRGRIYLTNGANAQLYKKIPDHLAGTIEPYYQWGGAIYSKNQLYFSVSAVDANTGAAINQYGGLWAVSTDTDAMRIVNRQSYGTYAGYISELAQDFTTSGVGNLTFLKTSIVTSWWDGASTFGMDYTPASPTPYSNYEAYIDSDMIPVGTYLNPTTDTNVEFKLTVPLVAGEGVKLAYRQNFSQSFTDITNGEFLTAGIISGVAKVSFQKSQWLQIRCYLKSTATTPSYVRLREIRLR